MGWRPFFQQQITIEEWGNIQIARVMAHHRTGFLLALIQQQSDDSQTKSTTMKLPATVNMPDMTVGDWVLLDDQHKFIRLLDRISEFGRKAPGAKLQRQMIAANVDTVFIVCSMNNDFNLSRIERYLTLSHEAGAEPIVVLTKLDLCNDPENYLRQVRSLDSMLIVEAVNGLDSESVKTLEPWCITGKTIAFLGSSGVGKSTMVNTLMGTQAQQTGDIREDDSKGRHTTTGRAISIMPSGGLLLDTPGMRELQLAASEHGISETFSDIAMEAKFCKFLDCQHQAEPGCAVLAAVEKGTVDQRRLDNYFKLMREQQRNGASLAQKHKQNRDFSKMVRSVMKSSSKRSKR